MSGCGTEGQDLTGRGLPARSFEPYTLAQLYEIDPVAARWRAGRDEETRNEWVKWLGRIPWVTFVTATFAPRSTETGTGPSYSRVTSAARHIERHLTRRLEGPSFFGVLERGSWSGRMHLHFLLSLDVSQAESAFFGHRKFQGFTKTIPLSSSFGVSEYVTKYVTKDRDPFWIGGGKAWRG